MTILASIYFNNYNNIKKREKYIKIVNFLKIKSKSMIKSVSLVTSKKSLKLFLGLVGIFSAFSL